MFSFHLLVVAHETIILYLPDAYAHVKYNSYIFSFQTDQLNSRNENKEIMVHSVDDHPPGEGEAEFSRLSSMNPVKLKRQVIFSILLPGICIPIFVIWSNF